MGTVVYIEEDWVPHLCESFLVPQVESLGRKLMWDLEGKVSCSVLFLFVIYFYLFAVISIC